MLSVEVQQWLKTVGATEIGRMLGMNPQSVHNMLNTGDITKRRRAQLAELSGQRFNADAFLSEARRYQESGPASDDCLVERHQIKPADPRFAELDRYCFLAKNLYNAANYECRARYIDGRRLLSAGYKPVKLLSYGALCRIMLPHHDFKALPCCVAQQVLRLLCANWHTYFSTLTDFRANPEKYEAEPKPPGYLHKRHGRFPIFYTKQGILKRGLKGSKSERNPVRGVGIPVVLCQTTIPYHEIQQIRIIPKTKHNSIYIEVMREQKPEANELNTDWVVGVDLGVTLIAAVASNKPGFVPR